VIRPVATALLLAVALAGHEAATLAASMRAHACCARTKPACSRLGSPDECCSRRGHLSARPIAATQTPAPDLDTSPADVAILIPSPSSTVTPPSRGVSKRPHDPPHLHAFSLLV